LFATAARLARYRGLLTGPAREMTLRRATFAGEIDAAASAINRLQHYYDQQQELT